MTSWGKVNNNVSESARFVRARDVTNGRPALVEVALGFDAAVAVLGHFLATQSRDAAAEGATVDHERLKE